MTSIKILFPLATFFAVACSSPLSYFYMYPLVPYYTIRDLDRAWKICPDNSTIIQTRYHEVVKEAQKCYGDLLQSNHSICHSFEVNVQRCSQPLVDYFVDCLPEKSKDLPPAIVKGAASVVETFCTSSGEILLEALNRCLYEYLDQRNKTIREECKQETLELKLDKFTVERPSKAEVCQVFREIGDCWQEYVNLDCESTKAKEFFSKFYDAALSACKK
ncbi:uncharacterized protein LOC108908946 [Anoplophora glabripennis]|uniref:DUF19 domain-containing protein n=1 Tax=Anoplophora glabripennis TaxID=217634 RepID=V5GGB2_ANOGL|nr:uncharacterized protein LOC108908946 [Anoplophora glabripennis]